jgi:hypothetical protein
MNFPVFCVLAYLGMCGLNAWEDNSKKSDKPLPQYVIGIGVCSIIFLSFVISIAI